MPTGLTIKGGPELKARLASLASAPSQMLGQWQSATVSRSRSTAPSRTGRGRASIHAAKLTDTRAEVRGAYWLIFVDRGTKAHDIRPKSLSGSGRGGPGTAKALKFDYRGQTIFTRKVHRRRMKRRPFLTQAAQEAFKGGAWVDVVQKAWTRRREGRFTKMR